MQNIVFPIGFIRANIFSALLCILLPVLFLWYYKRKTGVKLGSFFVGAAFCLLFTFLAYSILNIVILSGLGLTDFFSVSKHPVYSAIYCSCSQGLVSTIGCYVGLKYAMKNRPGKESALVFGVGMGGFECILNGTTVYITNLIAAILINSVGSAEYFKKLGLTGKELAESQKLFADQAATPASVFLVDATYLILSLVLYAALSMLVFRAIENKENHLVAVAIVLHILGYAPMYLRNIPLFENSMVLFIIATIYTFAIALFGYQTYQGLKSEKKR